ncbi:hypothetical protein MKW98_025295 [Papaver atlanticum]|uniref:Retrotransposon gag domain-containing protein n=1 Tax=Papaver atlanticum TaxID=357466 RepID=A0AAD4XV04_9MAGN|nr:hypothetical protein MKW98_025295 [Papaver atlanticum]
MSGRGRGRRGAINGSNARGNGNGKAPNFADMMRMMTETLTTVMTNQTAAVMAFIQNHNGNHNAPPPPPGGNMNDNNHQGGGDQAEWLNLLEKFIKLKPPVFEGSLDPLVVDKWKEDIDKIFVAMRCTQVHRQQLWWNNASIGLNLDTLTYIQFYECLDAKYFPATVRDKKINEFAEVAQIRGELVDDYLDMYIRLSRFAIYMIPDEEKSARKFERGLGDHIRNKVVSHCFPTFQQVVESARATEADWLRHTKPNRTGKILKIGVSEGITAINMKIQLIGIDK